MKFVVSVGGNLLVIREWSISVIKKYFLSQYGHYYQIYFSPLTLPSIDSSLDQSSPSQHLAGPAFTACVQPCSQPGTE